MPDVSPFRGVRYDVARVGTLSDVVAPPYDVIDPALQDRLYQASPYNIIRLELNRAEPGDTESQARYTRAARFLRDWLRHGTLNVTQGKNFDRSGSVGPWIVTTDELDPKKPLHLTTRVNGELRQDDSTDRLTCGFAWPIRETRRRRGWATT